MASLDFRVLSQILHTPGNMGRALRAGLRPETFQDPDARAIFRFVEGHYRNSETFKKVPLIETVESRFPSFRLAVRAEDYDNVETLVKELKAKALSNDLTRLAAEFAEQVDDDAQGALQAMMNSLPAIAQRFHSSGGFGIQDIYEGFEQHLADAASGAIYGIPWIWEPLTEDTLGKNKGDFTVFYGRMKSMKTWMLLANMAADYALFNSRVLFWSREMDKRKIVLRMASILAGVDYQLLKKAKLPRPLRERARKILKELTVQTNQALTADPRKLKDRLNSGVRDIVLLVGRHAPKTFAQFAVEIDRYQPDVVYVDSFYHMESERTSPKMAHWLKIQCIAEDLKGLALDEEVPIIGAAQANREGEKIMGGNLTEMAGSDAISRECDHAIRVIKRPRNLVLNEPEYEGGAHYARGKILLPHQRSPNEVPTRIGAELALLMPGNREGTLDGIKIKAVPGYNWQFMDFLTVEQTKMWVEEDAKEAKREAAMLLGKEAKAETKRVKKGPDHNEVGGFKT